MNNWQQQVADFMLQVKGLELPTRPTTPNNRISYLCTSLIREEENELYESIEFAANEPDNELRLVPVADALVDLIYVTLYTANAYGIDLEPYFSEVHRSNMLKRGGLKREDGKQLKPEGWQPPRLEAILQWQLRDNFEWLNGFKGKQVSISNCFVPTTAQDHITGRVDSIWIDKPYPSLLVMTGLDNYLRADITPFTTIEVN